MLPNALQSQRGCQSIPGCLIMTFLLVSLPSVLGQVTNSTWVYPSSRGNLLYQLDERGQRVTDFSNCGYKGGGEPLPNVSTQIDQSRWVFLSPGDGDDTARIQSAIDTVSSKSADTNGWRGVVYLNAGEYQIGSTILITNSGIVLKGAGSSSTTGTRLRATAASQYTLVSVTGSGNRSTVSGTTRNLNQPLVPSGTRSFSVDSTAGLSVGNTLIIYRPSTTNWISDIGMDQLLLDPNTGNTPWYAGTKDLSFDRVITRIDGNWITVDAPLPQTFETKYGGGKIWRYTWTGRIQQVGIEDLYGFSDYAGSTDENHSWIFISMANIQNGWVRNIISQYFAYAAVQTSDGAKWITVTDSQCLDPISIITGGRRYSFDIDAGELCLFVNNYARQGRHNYVFGSLVPGPNAFVHGVADASYADAGPHHRWSTGGLFDNISINGDELNAQNRGNMGTGHGWSGAYMTMWNSVATAFRVRNPSGARNWLIGSIGSILPSKAPVGLDPEGTYDSSGTGGKAVYPHSLYYGQLQQRLKYPSSEFREVWLGDIDQFSSTNGAGESVSCNANWLAEIQSMGTPADAKFDYLVAGRRTAFTFDFPLDAGSAVVAASLTIGLRASGSADGDTILLDGTNTAVGFPSLGWTPISTNSSSIRTLEVDPKLLVDGRLNVALGTNSTVDFAVLNLQIQKAQPETHNVLITAEADATVQGGTSQNSNYGNNTLLEIQDSTPGNTNREAFIRWDLAGVSGALISAKVRLSGTVAGQIGNENSASLVSGNVWDEKTITFNNKPSSGKLFAQWVPVTGQASEFIVTPQANERLLDDGKLSLRIQSTGNFGGLGKVSYSSRKSSSPSDYPQLLLTFSGTNTAPLIIHTGDLKGIQDTPREGISVIIGDTTTPSSSLTLKGHSSDSNLITDQGIVFGGSGTNRTVSLTPRSGQLGSATITLTVSDGELSTSDSFLYTSLPKVPVVITLSNTIQSYDGRSKAVTATVTPDYGLPLILTYANDQYGPTTNPPTNSGSYNVVATITDPSVGASVTGILTILPSPIITGSMSVLGVKGTAIGYQISAIGSPSSYSATGLPSGLKLDSVTGYISGTPTQNGSSQVVVTASNLSGSGSSTLTISVSNAISELSSVYTNPAMSTWTCPANVSALQVECWGGGGAGGSAMRNPNSNSTQYGGGGAGGSYARVNSYPVIPGNIYYIGVGAGGSNNSSVAATVIAGENSWFNATNATNLTAVIAKGGAGGGSAVGNTSSSFGAGAPGSTNGNKGDVLYAGGNGAGGLQGFTGGGGSSAGTNNSGNNAQSNVGGTAPAGGAGGGTGLTTNSGIGGNGSLPGGGGSGARSGNGNLYKGGDGANGKVVLLPKTFISPATMSFSSTNLVYDGTPRAVTVTSTPSDALPLQVTYGSATYPATTNPPTNAGNYVVQASVLNSNYSGSYGAMLSISKANASILISKTRQPYNGLQHPVDTISSPSSLPVEVSYAGSPSAPVAIGNYQIQASITDSNYSGSGNGTLAIYDAVAAWRESSYGTTSPSGRAADNAITSNRMNNVQCYTFGVDPFAPLTTPLLTISNGSRDFITIGFLAMAAGTNAGYEGLTRYYNLEGTTNLASNSWIPMQGFSNIPGSNQPVSLTTNISSGVRWFYRLKAWLQ